MFGALQERPEALNALLGAHRIVSESILGAFWSSEPPMVASRQPLQRPGSLLEAYDSCLARLDNQFQRSESLVARQITNSSKKRADWSIERASKQVQTTLSSSRSA